MKKLAAIMFSFVLMACSENPKDFSSVEVGMSSKQVLQYAGEPDKKQNLGVADLWVYEKADRTVVLRNDTVYDIITSADARMDSIKSTLDKIGDTIEKQAEKAGNKLDSVGRTLKRGSTDDTVRK
jgi:hypothetical protein